jgi:hypothetical protein
LAESPQWTSSVLPTQPIGWASCGDSCNPNYSRRKQKSGGCGLRPQGDLISTNGWAWWCVPVIPAIQGSINRRFTVQDSSGIKWDSISKMTNKARSMAQVVEHLPRKCKVLSSKPVS